VTAGTFLPASIDNGAQTDFTEFCLSCHNATAEAHDRSVGSASTLNYVNQTGIDKSAAYSGNAHSWNGVNGNAGTATPTLMGGTTHMPGGTDITCQVCHEGMDKVGGIENIDWLEGINQGDNLNYAINGYAATEQSLAQYIRVYRATVATTRPTNSRAKKAYLVNPSEYTYNYANATITFLAAQTPTDYIYGDISQPYFRDGNTANALCLNCHGDRVDTSVSHPGDTGVDNHPVTMAYGYSGGLHDTMKGSPDANIYIEGGDVLCTSCHDPHNSMSDDGMITRAADSNELCTDCHKVNGYDNYTAQVLANHNGAKHSTPTMCLDCHTTHGTDNIVLIKNTINGKTVNFRNFSGANSFGNDTGDSVCEACHTATSYHLASGGGTGHNTDKDCTECHTHATGFGGGGCTGCHGMPPEDGNAGPGGWADTTGDAHVSHVSHLEGAGFGLSGNAVCTECHGAAIPRGDHSSVDDGTGKDSAGMDTATWASWTGVGGNYGAVAFDYGTTIGKVNTADDTCSDVSCHSGAGTRVWAGGSDCNSCHSYPVAGSDWSAGNGHASRYDGLVSHMLDTGYDETSDTYLAMTTDVTRCGKCHYNSLGDESNHKNGTKDVAANGSAACGPATEFTINVNTSGSDVTCSNVKCHTANTNTPNWW
jgi:predicted CxxxxCH...CXXCH cytochrome family protein